MLGIAPIMGIHSSQRKHRGIEHKPPTNNELGKLEEGIQQYSNQHTTQTNDANATDGTFTRYLPTNSANTHMRNALLNVDATKDIQVADIGTTKTGYVIRFKDQ